ncbi:GNAT family N-acetyltransferase [Labrenzia aggregata]|uniref:GNAT family N-acetyltransferase n=1 Tax=Roseibium aggregatum TaxID=187304 RepID=A0A939E9B6_9HYPH|nr:GNAT family N-acetyltransferase [Roseibium aggregatum]
MPEITRLIGDFAVSRMLSVVPHPYSVEDAETWFLQTEGQTGNGERVFAIELDSRAAGAVSVGKPAEAPEFGYWLGRSYWGRGFMTEAGRAALAWLFETTDTQTVMSGALDENTASLNVLSKLGFTGAHTYSLSVKSRGETLPGMRVQLSRERFETLKGGAS